MPTARITIWMAKASARWKCLFWLSSMAPMPPSAREVPSTIVNLIQPMAAFWRSTSDCTWGSHLYAAATSDVRAAQSEQGRDMTLILPPAPLSRSCSRRVRAAGTPCCAARRLPTTRWPASWARWGCSESARAPVMHGDRAATERLRRDQLEPSRAGQPALVQGRAVAGDPGVDEELVLVDQIQPVQLGRELAATEEHAGRGRVLELLHARAQVARDVVAVGPREVLSRRLHHVQ